MILQAKARPVRIRIKSGGKEHSSFESLKRHFCIKDLLPSAKDGRLSRWLRQQGEDSVANCIDAQSNELPSTEELTEQAYIKFVLAFFESDFKHSQISTRQGLLEQWNTTSYANCHECQNLAKEIADALAKEEKAREDEKMRNSYSLALQMYKNNNGSRSKIEWMDIFSGFENQRKEDAEYFWLMYEITNIEKYLERSAQLGNERAKDILMPKRFGKEIRVGLFVSVLSQIPSELNNRKQRAEATRMIANLSAKLGTKIEQTIVDDILRLLNACNGYMCSGDFSEILENVQILKDEALFLQGVFYRGRDNSKRAAELLLLSEHPLAPLFRDFIYEYGKGFIIAKDSLCEIDRKEVNADMFRYGTSLSSFGMITHFVIAHIFDTICYEKL